jgi:hypothetical protein
VRSKEIGVRREKIQSRRHDKRRRGIEAFLGTLVI